MRSVRVLVGSSLAFACPAAATCVAPVPATAVADTLSASLRAFGDADRPAFLRSAEQLDATLPCLSELLSPMEAASVHRVEGLLSFVRPVGHPIEQAFEAALSSPSPRIPLPPFVGRAFLDGQQTPFRQVGVGLGIGAAWSGRW